MNARGDCPTCVRVVCQHLFVTDGINPISWICGWSGYRPASRRGWGPCPKCRSHGEFKVMPVRHRLWTHCPSRRYARGEGPVT